MPVDFIPLAEETGLILPIGEWVLRQACEQLKRWRDAGSGDLRMAVNLSTRQFYQPGFEKVVAAVLAENGLPSDALELEITESVLMQPSQDNMLTLEQFSTMGVQLSVDDFGTGYSSLAYLQHFPIHVLKIDRSFVVGIGRDARNDAIVISIIALAQALHLKVIAEGVDSAEQVAFLTANGCHTAQGYYYSQAVSAQAFGKLCIGKHGCSIQHHGMQNQ